MRLIGREGNEGFVGVEGLVDGLYERFGCESCEGVAVGDGSLGMTLSTSVNGFAVSMCTSMRS